MKCVIYQFGETEPGTTTVALTRNETTIVIRDVPAQICTTCGEVWRYPQGDQHGANAEISP